MGKDALTAEYPETGIMIISEVVVTRSEEKMASSRPDVLGKWGRD